MEEKEIYPHVVVLTGSIGSGKSTAAQILAQLGATVVSADSLARKAVEPESKTLKEIARVFGDQVINRDGSLNRSELAGIVFSSAEKLKILEDITHPQIRSLALEEFKSALGGNPKLLLYDCPLYFEANLDKLPFKASVLIAAEPDTCLKRAILRGGMSEEDIKKRMRQQIPISKKREKADYVIENSGSIEDLREKLKRLWDMLTAQL